MTEPLRLGQLYSRLEIHELFGGSRQSYLPMREGVVVCGCFDPSLNLRAPLEIDVGEGPIIVGSAEVLVNSHVTIPVFLKRGTNQWESVGKFKALDFSRRPEDVRAHADRRPDAVGVLFLEEVDEAGGETAETQIEPFSAEEGRAILRQHVARERKPQLIAAKKRLVLAAKGALICEACDLTSADLPVGLGEACFEGHHLVPLAQLNGQTLTRLDDLALLCANCHRMIHNTVPLASVEALRASLHTKRGD